MSGISCRTRGSWERPPRGRGAGVLGTPSAQPGLAKAGAVGDRNAGCWKDRARASRAAGKFLDPGKSLAAGPLPPAGRACRVTLGLRAASPSPPLSPGAATRGPLGREFPGGGVVLRVFWGSVAPAPG